jgi:DNA-binding response OmpR family regulator
MVVDGNIRRILLIEGDPLQRQLIREYLEIVGQYKVQESKGLFHLLSACESPLSGLSLVLLDMEWSRVDGVDLILEIRKRNPRLPILGMTDRQADLYGEPRLRGCSIGFIRKPFSPYHLHRSITATLKSHAADLTRRGQPKAPLHLGRHPIPNPYEKTGASR